MKQLIICKNYGGGNAKDYTSFATGNIGFIDVKNLSLINSAPKNNFAIVCGRGTDKMPINIPEVDLKSLAVEKATYAAGVKFSAKITIPTPTKGEEYTVVIVKKGVTFNERNSWTATTIAKDNTAVNVAKEIVRQINANTMNLGVTASNSNGVITITGVNEGEDYVVYGADTLMGVEPTNVVTAKKAILDKVYVQDLASRCAADKGFNDVYPDGHTIYPGYPENVPDSEFTMYTLRFAVPRAASKRVDEVVWQVVHIVVEKNGSAIAALDTILLGEETNTTSGTSITSL